MFIHNKYQLKSHLLLSLSLCCFLVKINQKCMFDDLIYQKFPFRVSLEIWFHKEQLHFFIIIHHRVAKQSSNKMVMMVWSASSCQKFHIWETLLTWPRPAVVLQLDPRCCGGDRSLWAQQSQIPRCLGRLSLDLSISMSCEQTLTRSSLKPSLSSMALILTLFLPAAVQSTRSCWMVEDTVGCDCLKVCCS